MDINVHFRNDPRTQEILTIVRNVADNIGVIVSNQENLENRVAALNELTVDLRTSVAGIEQAIAELKNTAPESLDFSSLDSAVADLSATVDTAAASDPGEPGVDTAPVDEEPIA